ncbi:MAG: AMP-binding protein [Candidatus Bipolaricaulota bacterium]|nr:AMP-binding protein [Candidatus Bipolaricaulota bacterium]MDW8110225.1 AMP-binding protein [Candidatus Bipolaricaulota bacterium]MDW8328875.1 AMP-binding protein [Candidatus Bipolaricaulota bacterium]
MSTLVGTQTIVEMVERSLSQLGAKIALKIPKPDGSYDQISYAELHKRSGQFAATLKRRGFRPGQHFALIGKPRTDWAVVYLGVLKAGGVVMPVDASWQAPEVQRVLKEMDVIGVAVSDAPHYEMVKDLVQLQHIVTMDRLPGIATVSDWLTEDLAAPSERQPEDLAVILCTSGTTGNAKGVMLAHENIVANLEASAERIDFESSDVVLSIAPWYHVFGMIVLLMTLRTGATLIYTDDYKNLPKYLSENRVSIVVGVPKLFHAMYEKLESTVQSNRLARFLWRYAPTLLGSKIKKRLVGGSQLKFFLSGGAPLDANVMKNLRRLGIGMIEGYGLTETSPVLTVSTPFNDKIGSVGPAIPGVELRIDDPDEHGVGEIVVRGPNIMRGYYKNPEATKKVIDPDGWFHTGDLGYLDEDGWLYIKGRKKNVIVLEGGKNVYPEELEFEFKQIPYIEEIMIKGGKRHGVEVIKAFVYPKPELLQTKKIEEIHRLIWEAIKEKSKNIAHYKRIHSQHDLIILDKPFEKTSKLDIKRYLYEGE